MKVKIALFITVLSIILVAGCIQPPNAPKSNVCIPGDKSCVTSGQASNAPVNQTDEFKKEFERLKNIVEGNEKSNVIDITETTEPSAAEEPKKLSAIPKITIDETDLLKLKPKAVDLDGNSVTFTYSTPLSESGTWQTDYGNAGEYKVVVTADNGKLKSTQDVLIVVKHKNRGPVFGELNPITVRETEAVDLSNTTAKDPDNDRLIYSFSGWMDKSAYTTGYEDAGNHTVTITAADPSGASGQGTITIIVLDTPRAPIITGIEAE